MKTKAVLIYLWFIVFLLIPHNGLAQKKNLYVEIKLMGGGAYIHGGDLNGDVEGYSQYMSDLTGLTPQGSAEPLHIGIEVAGEIGLKLFNRVGIFFGIGYFKAQKNSNLTFALEGGDLVLNHFPEINTLPISVKIELYPFRHFYVFIGGEYYSPECSFAHRLTVDSDWTSVSGNAEAKGYGLVGGVGVEIALSRNILIVLEGKARKAQLDNFEGKMVMDNSLGYSWEEEGVLCRFPIDDSSNAKQMLTITQRDNIPGSILEVATIDLSGFSFNIGFKLRL